MTQQKPCPRCKVLIDVGEKLCGICLAKREARQKEMKQSRQKAYDKERGSSTERGYDRRWRKARADYLAVHPLCVECYQEGRVREASIVDHIVPHKGSVKLFWNRGNWQSLCKYHHDIKTSKGL